MPLDGFPQAHQRVLAPEVEKRLVAAQDRQLAKALRADPNRPARMRAFSNYLPNGTFRKRVHLTRQEKVALARIRVERRTSLSGLGLTPEDLAALKADARAKTRAIIAAAKSRFLTKYALMWTSVRTWKLRVARYRNALREGYSFDRATAAGRGGRRTSHFTALLSEAKAHKKSVKTRKADLAAKRAEHEAHLASRAAEVRQKLGLPPNTALQNWVTCVAEWAKDTPAAPMPQLSKRKGPYKPSWGPGRDSTSRYNNLVNPDDLSIAAANNWMSSLDRSVPGSLRTALVDTRLGQHGDEGIWADRTVGDASGPVNQPSWKLKDDKKLTPKEQLWARGKARRKLLSRVDRVAEDPLSTKDRMKLIGDVMFHVNGDATENDQFITALNSQQSGGTGSNNYTQLKQDIINILTNMENCT